MHGAGAVMRIAGGDSSGGEGFSSSLAASLLRRRGEAGGVDVVGFACGEEGEEGFYGVGGEGREDDAIVGEVEEVVKRNLKGVELLTWGDVGEFCSVVPFGYGIGIADIGVVADWQQ